MDFYPTRNINLGNDDPIVGIVQEILESRLRVKLTLHEAELQTWYNGSSSSAHRHNYNRSCPDEDYNSVLYLNNDFEDGVFFTESIKIKPVPGRLTFFNGRDILHGVTPVKKAHRHSVIFWWKNTQFY